MSKNLTRKGLAFGALVALGSSVIAGTPAQAATVNIDVAAGTGNTTILGESFTVRATLDSLVPSSSFGTLKFKVTNDTGAALTYGYGTTNVDGSAATASSGTSDVVSDGAPHTTSTGDLSISSAATSAHSVSVVAFLDADGGNDLDAGEYQTAAYEVKFVKVADAGITAAWSTALQAGDGTVKAKLTSSVINVAQVNAAHLAVQFGKYISGTATKIVSANGAYGTLTASSVATGVVLNSDKNALETAATSVSYTDGTAQTTLTEGTYVAQAVYGSNATYSAPSTTAGSAAFVKVGSEITAGVSAAKANAANSSTKIVTSENVTSLGLVRKGYTGDVTVQVTVKDADKAVLAGKTVRLSTGSSLSGTFKINGVDAAASKSYDAVTNASGVATFVVTSTYAADTNLFDISSITAEGIDVSTGYADLDWTAATYTLYEKGVFATNDFKRGVDKSTSASLEIVALDQWKKALTSADFRLTATLSGRTVAVIADDLSDGSAKFTITDGALTDGQTTVALAFEEKASGTWGAATTYTPSALSNRVYYWYSQTDKVDITYDSASAAISGEALVAVDTRLSNTAVAGSMNAASISGTVRNATTVAAKDGALLTISGPSNVLFNVGNAYAFGSLTFFDADGTFAVNAYSTTVQKTP
jgi:hypothetical protein